MEIVSAAYNCSDKSRITQEQEEIKLGGKKTINGIGIGLIFSDEITVFARFTAELLVDAEKISLSNQTSFVDVELKTSKYRITLINFSSESAIIKVDSSKDSIYENELKEIGGLKVFLVESQGSHLGEGSADFILGKNRVILSNDENPTNIIKINNTEYLLELFSASEDNAIVSVKRCKTGKIIKIDENAVNPSVADNQTNNISVVDSEKNETSEIKEDNENIAKNDSEEIDEDGESREDKGILEKTVFYGLIGFIVIIMILVLILYLKTKFYKEEQKIVLKR